MGNQYSPTTVVAAISRTVPPRSYPFVVVLEPSDSGLPERSAVNCAQLATIHQQGPDSRLRPSRGQRELRPIGQLSLTRMAEVDAALKYNLALG